MGGRAAFAKGGAFFGAFRLGVAACFAGALGAAFFSAAFGAGFFRAAFGAALLATALFGAAFLAAAFFGAAFFAATFFAGEAPRIGFLGLFAAPRALLFFVPFRPFFVAMVRHATPDIPNRQETIGMPLPTSFHPAVRAWFDRTFEAPTEPHARGWAAITQSRGTLITSATAYVQTPP